MKPTDGNQSQAGDHGIHLDTAVWQFVDKEDNEDQDIALTIFDSCVTVIPVSDHNTPEVKLSKQKELDGWKEFRAKLEV